MKSTDGANWNTTWNLNENVNTWFGITVENNMVTEINLSMKNLSGEIPATIGNLQSLETINLGFNKINGVIPNEIYFLSCTKK